MQSIVISVPVTCSDGNIEVDINTLLKIEYFNRLLTSNIGTCKLTSSKAISTDGKSINYNFNIPIITVDCSKKVFEILLHSKDYYVYPDRYNDELIELLLYNDMYDMGLNMRSFTYGFGVKEYISLVYFIKQKLPNMNHYEVLTRGGFRRSQDCIDHLFILASTNELDKNILPDILQYIKQELLMNDNQREMIEYLHILDTIITHYNEYPEIISKQINDQIISSVLQSYIARTKYQIEYLKIRYTPRIAKMERNRAIERFNDNMLQLKDRIIKMNQLGIINDIDFSKYILSS